MIYVLCIHKPISHFNTSTMDAIILYRIPLDPYSIFPLMPEKWFPFYIHRCAVWKFQYFIVCQHKIGQKILCYLQHFMWISIKVLWKFPELVVSSFLSKNWKWNHEQMTNTHACGSDLLNFQQKSYSIHKILHVIKSFAFI